MRSNTQDFLRLYLKYPKRLVSLLTKKSAGLLASASSSSELIGPPKGFYRSTKVWSELASASADGDHNLVSYLELYPEQPLKRSPPITVEPNIHWKFEREYQKTSPAAFAAIVPRGRVFGEHSSVITSDDKLLEDVSKVHGNKSVETHPVFSQIKLPKLYAMSGSVAVLSVAGGHGFFHWMFDLLPRLHLLQKAGMDLNTIDWFIVNEFKVPFQRETLAHFGIFEDRIIESKKLLHVKAERLILPSLAGRTGNMPSWVCDFLRREFLPKENFSDINAHSRIYVSRNGSRHRKILNEEALLPVLEKFGFRQIRLEDFSIYQQASMFSQAQAIISPHGAGLSNLVFCQTHTKVIEIFSPNYVNVCFWALSTQLKLEYYYLLGAGKQPKGLNDPHKSRENISVDIDDVKKTLAMALGSSESA
ncbi:glycosyltransferase family 61 protein [Leptolyngbya sp. BC1307]|uniref:glycosyltransferase family 61 protein n=1 Tax=Leptolyngbya sp. BC1307 TaxID=2029589 RepID=UPI000EFC404D|nr:glycosyltransferase family 61 protein [Leptolyngbya sp. BC1307]